MSGFLYFLPGQSAVNENFLKFHGFEELYGENMLSSQRGVNAGPEGVQGGVVFSIVPRGSNKRHANPGFFKDTQTWIKCPDKDYWIGYYTEDKPTPEELEKAEAIDGYLADLEDGNKWIIPIARNVQIGCTLPQVLALGKDGKMIKETIPKFLEISRKAEKAWNAIIDAHKEENERVHLMEDDEAIEIAMDAIILNYTLDKTHILILKIISTINVGRILNFLVDFPGLENLIEISDAIKEGEDDIVKKKSQPAPSGEDL